MSAAAPPILDADGELTPWADAVATQYARSIIQGDQATTRKVEGMLSSSPEYRALREICGDMRTSRALALVYGGARDAAV